MMPLSVPLSVLPPPLLVPDPSMELPTKEKPLLAVILLTVFFNNSRGEGACWNP
jgi:hypothetical protein